MERGQHNTRISLSTRQRARDDSEEFGRKVTRDIVTEVALAQFFKIFKKENRRALYLQTVKEWDK